jgi:hypothetical protein
MTPTTEGGQTSPKLGSFCNAGSKLICIVVHDPENQHDISISRGVDGHDNIDESWVTTIQDARTRSKPETSHNPLNTNLQKVWSILSKSHVHLRRLVLYSERYQAIYHVYAFSGPEGGDRG